MVNVSFESLGAGVKRDFLREVIENGYQHLPMGGLEGKHVICLALLCTILQNMAQCIISP